MMEATNGVSLRAEYSWNRCNLNGWRAENVTIVTLQINESQHNAVCLVVISGHHAAEDGRAPADLKPSAKPIER